MLSVSQKVFRTIEKIPENITFGYEQLPIDRNEIVTAAKAIERLQKRGIIKRLSKGKFYKPKMTIFGERTPGEQELLKSYLYKNGERFAYITGTSLYNQMGLTTQIPSVIHIASRSRRNLSSAGSLKLRSVKSYVEVTEDNYQTLGFLDALKDINQIPDLDMTSVLSIFQKRIKALSPVKQQQMIGIALFYPARVKALLGALLEEINLLPEPNMLQESLNPFTKFALGIDNTILATASNWKIQ